MDKLPVFVGRDDVKEPLIGSLGRARDAEEAKALILAKLMELHGPGENPPHTGFDGVDAVEDDVEVRSHLKPHDVPHYRRLAAEHRGIHPGDIFATEGHGGMILSVRCWVGVESDG